MIFLLIAFKGSNNVSRSLVNRLCPQKIFPCQCKISFFDIENDDDNPIKREWINAQNFITT